MQTGDGTRLYHQAAITMICLVVLLIGVLAEEVNLLNRSSVCSERLIVFLTFMLQRDNMVNKGRDIRRLLKRRMMTWKSEHFDDLLFDFKSCSKHLKKCSRMKSDESHIAKVFTHLMMKGQVRAAVRWITERTSKGGVLDASTYVGSGCCNLELSHSVASMFPILI